MSWTSSDVPNLSGKTILITGANSGVGFQASKLFAANNACVILACRNVDKMAAAAAAIKSEIPSANLVQMQLDVSDLDSVRAFVDTLKTSQISQIDVLLLNAGAMIMEYHTSKQGDELMFATNHLGHWLLTGLLLNYMKDVPDSRIVAVSSIGHNFTNEITYDVAKGANQSSFDYFKTYTETKLANQWFVRALQRKLEAAGAKTVAVACHPGAAATDLARHTEGSFLWKIVAYLMMPFEHSAERGSLLLVMAAVDSVEDGFKAGNYYGPKNWFGLNGPPVRDASLSKTVFDEKKQQQLWQVSEELCGFAYPI